jgi:hypothetical protein
MVKKPYHATVNVKSKTTSNVQYMSVPRYKVHNKILSQTRIYLWEKFKFMLLSALCCTSN